MAYRNKKDVHHKEADGIVRSALKGEFGKVYTSDYVYDETLTLTMVRTGRKEIALDVSEVMLSPRIEMVFVDSSILKDAGELFFKHFDKRISFTDAVTMVVMDNLGIENIVTFDSDFDGMYNVLF